MRRLDLLVEEETAESITLANGVVIDVITANIAAPRGRSYACVVVEEAAFLPADETANPDVEILRAIRPGLARVRGSLLVVIGSPWARRGVMWTAHEKWAESGGDETHLFVTAPTLQMNPTFDASEVTRALEEDPESAGSEYLAEFRSDLESYCPIEIVDAVTIPNRFEMPPVSGISYSAFVDPSGGSHDSFTCAIAHADGPLRVLDVLREFKAPCAPDQVVQELNPLLRTYGITIVTGDRYSGNWVRDAFARYGIQYLPSERSKSELYTDLLPVLRSSRVELLDDETLQKQLTSLERRVGRGTGREVVDHPPGGRDDVANAVAGALVLVENANAVGRGIAQFRHGEPWSGWIGGLLYRNGQPWEGICPPDFDAQGRALNSAVRYENGQIVGAAPGWRPPKKTPGKFTRTICG